MNDRGSSRRQRQAQETRRDLLVAARRLFASQGYARTSMAKIAAEAGVSVQTIYDSVGSKAALVAALNDLIDEEGGVAALASRIPAETDPASLLDIAVSISRNINERCADIVGAVYGSAGLEPELTAVRDESRRRHRDGIRGLTRRLVTLDAIPRGREQVTADAIAAMTDPDVARTFVVGYGWSWDQWHAWTLRTLVDVVLRQEEPSVRRARSRR